MVQFEKILKRKIQNDYNREIKDLVEARRTMQLTGPLKGLPMKRATTYSSVERKEEAAPKK